MTSLDDKVQKKLVTWVSRNHPGIPKSAVAVLIKNINDILEMDQTKVKNVAAVQLGALRVLAEVMGISKIKGATKDAGDAKLPNITFTIPGIS
jgi:hypothetical protein